MVRQFIDYIGGESTIVHAYRCNAAPCNDCRYCWEQDGCCIDDGMQEIYRLIQQADTIVIASPIYFANLTGQLLAVLSRLQAYYCARVFQGKQPIKKEKSGAILLTGGGDGSSDMAERMAKILLRQMHVQDILPTVLYHNTNQVPLKEDTKITGQLQVLAQELKKKQ